MSETYVGEYREREKKLRSKASARSRWIGRNWKRSAKGNIYMKLGDHIITVMPSRFHKGKWVFGIGNCFSKPFPDEESAKLALFEKFWDLTDGAMGR